MPDIVGYLKRFISEKDWNVAMVVTEDILKLTECGTCNGDRLAPRVTYAFCS
jgi:hypothetical protein